MTVTEISGKASESKGSAVLAGLRKAAKAAEKASSKTERDAAAADGLKFARGIREAFGEVDCVTEYVRGDEMVSAGQALIAEHKAHAEGWFKSAHAAKSAGITSKAWAEATGSSAMMLGRLSGAWDLFEAARENKTPITLAESYRQANRLQRNQVEALILAYREAEEGTDPTADPNVPVVAPVESMQTVESYVKALDALAERLSKLLDGEFSTPKAETLERLKAQSESIARVAKQHETLTSLVAKAGRTPKARKAS